MEIGIFIFALASDEASQNSSPYQELIKYTRFGKRTPGYQKNEPVHRFMLIVGYNMD